LEEALAYRRLIDEFKLTQAEVAQKVGKSREVVGNKVRLLDLPYEIQRDLSDGKISEGHAKVLLALKNPEKQRFLAKEVMVKGMSVRALEELVKVEEAYQHKVKNIDPILEEYKKTVQDAIGAPVNISGSKEKGRLAINFYSEVDLERIIKKLAS
jgi:ParB family chromosome partitioning protein